MEQREFFTDYGEANRWVLLGLHLGVRGLPYCHAAMQSLHCGSERC